MDFDDTPAEAEFRAEVTAFLAANAKPKDGARRNKARDKDAAYVAWARDWQARKADAGLAAITWPVRFGGRGGTAMEQVIYNQEEERYLVPQQVYNQGVGLCLPTLMAHWPAERVDLFAGPAMRGTHIWCQLFSEPAAGSDLAGIRTRAVRDGDGWLVTGQKIWTSNAHFADYAILLARTDPAVHKHAGLTFFVLDMRTPGIEVRRIRQISGPANFNEVFLTDVRIPDADRVGAVGAGFKVAMTTLMHERFATGAAEGPDFEDAFELARTSRIGGAPAIADAAVRQRLAEWYVQAQGLKYTRYRTLTALSRGAAPGPEASITKLVAATKLQEIASFGIDLAGPAGMVADPDLAPMDGWFQDALLYAPGKRISGGTDEILRTIIGERVLKLPPEARVDKDVPFRDLPVGRQRS